MLRSFLLVGLGSFLGGGLRFLVSKWAQTYVHNPFPLGTFLVNVMGCFLIGLFYAWFERGHISNPDIRLFLTVGVCGGFTTFSTFMNENYRLMKSDSMLWMAFYAASSLFVGLLCVWLGYKAMR